MGRDQVNQVQPIELAQAQVRDHEIHAFVDKAGPRSLEPRVVIDHPERPADVPQGGSDLGIWFHE
jgi:hypothetical protein